MAFSVIKPAQFYKHMLTVKTWNGEKTTEEEFRVWFAKQSTTDLKLMLTLPDGTLLYRGTLPSTRADYASAMAKAMIKAKAPATAPSKSEVAKASAKASTKPSTKASTKESTGPTESQIKRALKADLEQMVKDRKMPLPEGKYTRADLIAMLL